MISIRQHCIPCYDEIARIETIATKLEIAVPQDLFGMEQKTAVGIIKKFHAIVKSSFFEMLPNSVIINSGSNQNYHWDKTQCIKEEERIWSEVGKYTT